MNLLIFDCKNWFWKWFLLNVRKFIPGPINYTLEWSSWPQYTDSGTMPSPLFVGNVFANIRTLSYCSGFLIYGQNIIYDETMCWWFQRNSKLIHFVIVTAFLDFIYLFHNFVVNDINWDQILPWYIMVCLKSLFLIKILICMITIKLFPNLGDFVHIWSNVTWGKIISLLCWDGINKILFSCTIEVLEGASNFIPYFMKD